MMHGAVQLVPLLGADRHAHPRHGGCLLEVVSSLIGGPWTDRPSSLDPLVGHLVRAVNDRTSNDERPALAQFAPLLLTLCSVNEGPGTTAVRRPRFGYDVLLRATTDTALNLIKRSEARHELLSAEAAAGRVRANSPRWRRLNLLEHRAAAQAISTAVRGVQDSRGDVGMRRLLTDVMTGLHSFIGHRELPSLDRAARHCAAAVPVVSELRSPGGDGMYVHWTAQIEEWPQWLRPEPATAVRSVDS